MLVYHLGGAGGTTPEKSRTKCLSMMDGLNVDEPWILDRAYRATCSIFFRTTYYFKLL